MPFPFTLDAVRLRRVRLHGLPTMLRPGSLADDMTAHALAMATGYSGNG